MATTHADELQEEQRRLLLLMAQGVPDTTIARQLSLGQRTLARRIANLYALLGVETRFQAGVVAERLGLLDPCPPDAAASPSVQHRRHRPTEGRLNGAAHR
ncbi:hypothetical protein [Nocardia rosealba]|uniref:hypothetical protein n=1 Tax=Nocardia rosealba TaxID=2878563 RepID=UPI001CD97280|nr:hypothetical protein [Nocardia rosealba]MCA2207235.1 hypothetical protein [Nocardia rosealba]